MSCFPFFLLRGGCALGLAAGVPRFSNVWSGNGTQNVLFVFASGNKQRPRVVQSLSQSSCNPTKSTAQSRWHRAPTTRRDRLVFLAHSQPFSYSYRLWFVVAQPLLRLVPLDVTSGCTAVAPARPAWRFWLHSRYSGSYRLNSRCRLEWNRAPATSPAQSAWCFWGTAVTPARSA